MVYIDLINKKIYFFKLVEKDKQYKVGRIFLILMMCFKLIYIYIIGFKIRSVYVIYVDVRKKREN